MESGARKARLIGARQLTYDTNEYTLEMVEPKEIRFRPGQFVSILCGADGAGMPVRRSYSIASPSTVRDRFALVVKLIPGGAASHFFGHMANGAPIEFTGPMGFFVLDLAHAGDIVFGATGTGIAPVIPMLDELSRRENELGRIKLYWGVRQPDDLFYEAELAELGARLPRLTTELCMTQPPKDWQAGFHGRINSRLLEAAATLNRPAFYLVGNGDMIKEMRHLLQERGVDRKRQIRTEAFFAATGATT